MRGTQIHPGMQQFAVYVGYVINNTFGNDKGLDFNKFDPIG